MRGLTAPRLTDLNGKKIGLFSNIKRAAPPINTVVEQELKERFPACEFSHFVREHYEDVTLTEDKARFEKWINGVDAVVAAVGD